MMAPRVWVLAICILPPPKKGSGSVRFCPNLDNSLSYERMLIIFCGGMNRWLPEHQLVKFVFSSGSSVLMVVFVSQSCRARLV